MTSEEELKEEKPKGLTDKLELIIPTGKISLFGKKKGKWKIGIMFDNVKEEVDQFFKRIKKNLDRERKRKLKKKAFYKLYQKLKHKIDKLDDSTSEIMEETSEIKEHASSINEKMTYIHFNTQEMIAMLETLDYKADSIDKTLYIVIPILEGIFDEVKEVEVYMKQNLGSDWQKLKNMWSLYKDEEVSKRAFLMHSLKTVGKKFVGIFK